MAGVLQVVQALRAALAGFDPEGLSGVDCATLVEELAATEKMCAVARVRAAARAGECGAHRERGFGDVSDWMARATGSTAGSAKAALETAAEVTARRQSGAGSGRALLRPGAGAGQDRSGGAGLDGRAAR